MRGMSEKESRFIKILTGVLSTFLVALIIGAFAFYRATIVQDALQDERISKTEKRVENLELFDNFFPTTGEFHRSVNVLNEKIQKNTTELEQVRKETREDFKDINNKLDRLIEIQLRGR